MLVATGTIHYRHVGEKLSKRVREQIRKQVEKKYTTKLKRWTTLQKKVPTRTWEIVIPKSDSLRDFSDLQKLLDESNRRFYYRKTARSEPRKHTR